MNKIEYLLDCLMEECAEIQKAASKTKRFGMDDFHPRDPKETPNWKLLEHEMYDLYAIVLMLQSEAVIGGIDLQSPKIGAKIDKVERYMEYSRERGTLE